MTLDQFEHMLSTFTFQLPRSCLTFPNRMLLVFVWIVKYPDYSLLFQIFGASSAVISQLIHTTLPLLAEHFVAYIPLRLTSPITSHLSPLIRCVIDATIHPIRKPAQDQHLYYNGNYMTHGLLTH